MYRAFELQIDDDMLSDARFSRFASYGKNKLSDSGVEIENLLREVYANGTIDGTALSNQYFPTLRCDVFLSYSHNDQDLAYIPCTHL